MKYFLLLSFIILFSGCSQKVSISYLAPAKIDRATQNKKISVIPFKNDEIGITSKLETMMFNKTVNSKPYFTMVSREYKKQIIEEQKFQYSGLVNEKNVVELGELIGAEAIITGDVSDASLNYSYFYQKRTKCITDDCEKQYEYSVRCTTGMYNLTFNIKMMDIQKGDIIYTETFNDNSQYSHCPDRTGGLPPKHKELDKLSDNLLNNFITSISPSIKSYGVELLDDPEIDYTNEQEDLLEYSLEYIELGQYNKAEELLSKLLISTKDKCYVAAYNLGIVKEQKNQFLLAQKLYKLSDSLILEPVEQVSQAVTRINKMLLNQKRLEEQLSHE